MPMKTLYFIESINLIQPDVEEERLLGSSSTIFSICLEDINMSKEIAAKNIQERFNGENNERGYDDIYRTIEIPKTRMKLDTGTSLYEGMFVYLEEENDLLQFTSGRGDDIAKEQIRENSRLRHQLFRGNTYLDNIADNFDYVHAQVKSYHVNVGSGNCTFVLFIDRDSYRLWMVDCGMIDVKNRRNYSVNIDIVIGQIARDINCDVSNVHIHRFLLTHWHADHYNGMIYMLQRGWLDSQTIFVMNLYYSCPTPCANQILHQLDRMNVRCYEPQVSLRLNNCSILHPNLRIGRWNNARLNMIGVRKVNDSSVVYSINGVGKNMIFSGDLEKKGFDRMTKAHTCRYCLHTSTYYCVSHHASLTGHIDIPCLSSSFPTVLACVLHNLKYAIVMGRDGAYDGIYDAQVIQDFGNRIIYSERDKSGNKTRGVALEWNSGKTIHIY